MGRISDIYKNILMELQVGYNNLNATEDEYEKVGYQYQIKGIKEKITYANNVLKNIFTKEQLEDICKQVLSAEDFDKTINDLNTKNEESLKTYTERIANKMKTTEESLTVLLQKNPGCVQEDNKKHKEYLNLLDTKNKCQEALDNPRHKVYTIFDILSEQNLNAFFIKIAETADTLETADEIADDIQAFEPVGKSKKGVIYPLKERLDEILKYPYLSYEFGKFLRENLDLINELTAVDTNDSVNDLYNNYVSEIEPIVERKGKEIFAEAVVDYNLEYMAQPGELVADTEERLNKVYGDNFVFKYSPETLATFKRLLNEMNNREMVPDDAKLEEEGTKVYAFAKFTKAKEKFIEAALKTGEDFNPDIFQYYFNELMKEVKKIEEMQGVINQNVGTNFDVMPTNVDIYRNPDIPRRFKQNLAQNEQMNNLYNVLVFIKENGISVDKFLEDPATALKEFVTGKAYKLNADVLVADMNKGQAIFALADANVSRGIDPYGLMRTIDFLNNLEANPEFKKHNSIVSAGMVQAFGNIVHTVTLNSRYFNESFANINETLQNVFLAEKEDGKILYSKCFAKRVGFPNRKDNGDDGSEYVDGITEAHRGFKVKDQQTVLHKISEITRFEATYYDVLTVVKQYHAASKEPQNAGILQNVGMKNLISAAQELCVKYLLTHDIDALNKEAQLNDDSPVVSKDFMTQMINFMKNPSSETVLNGINLEGMGRPDLVKIVKNRQSLMNSKEKEVIKAVNQREKEFIRIFKEINKRMDALDARVDAIAENIGQGQTNEEIEAIGMQHRQLLNQLMEAQNKRIEELIKEYESGRIPKYYYEKRVEQVKTLQNVDQIPPLFKADEPQYKDFKTYKNHVINEIMKKIENGENAEFPTSDEELKEQYKEIVDPLKSEKMLYLADHVLSAHGIKTLKALESKNEFAVKSEMLQINEQTYKQANELVATEEELRTMIVVDEVAEIYPNNNNIILDDNEEEVLQKENVNNLI